MAPVRPVAGVKGQSIGLYSRPDYTPGYILASDASLYLPNIIPLILSGVVRVSGACDKHLPLPMIFPVMNVAHSKFSTCNCLI